MASLSSRYGVNQGKDEEGPWRASVLNTATKERTYFSTAEALVAFLSHWLLDEEALLWR
jgi:hypothetical protein